VGFGVEKLLWCVGDGRRNVVESPVTEKIVYWAWRTSVLSLIAATGLGGVVLAYCGMMGLMARQWSGGSAMAMGGISLGGAAWLLIRNRDDLVGT
jgi:hypothetical protein